MQFNAIKKNFFVVFVFCMFRYFVVKVVTTITITITKYLLRTRHNVQQALYIPSIVQLFNNKGSFRVREAGLEKLSVQDWWISAQASLDQQFLKCAIGPAGSASPGNLLEKGNLSGLAPDLQNQKLWEWALQ